MCRQAARVDSAVLYRQRQCEVAECRLRFPVQDESELGSRCPVCGGPTHFVDAPYPTYEVRERRLPAGPPLEGLLDNVRSLSNVGSIFRTADGVGLGHLHLCGFTPTPEHPKLAKTALGAQASVAWTRHPDGARAAEEIAAQGKRLWALEGGPGSRDLFESIDDAGGPEDPTIVVVVGHEVSGVDPRILDRCERIVRIPMVGHKGSLNVSVAFGIAVYLLRYGRGVIASV